MLLLLLLLLLQLRSAPPLAPLAFLEAEQKRGQRRPRRRARKLALLLLMLLLLLLLPKMRTKAGRDFEVDRAVADLRIKHSNFGEAPVRGLAKPGAKAWLTLATTGADAQTPASTGRPGRPQPARRTRQAQLHRCCMHA